MILKGPSESDPELKSDIATDGLMTTGGQLVNDDGACLELPVSARLQLIALFLILLIGYSFHETEWQPEQIEKVFSFPTTNTQIERVLITACHLTLTRRFLDKAHFATTFSPDDLLA